MIRLTETLKEMWCSVEKNRELSGSIPRSEAVWCRGRGVCWLMLFGGERLQVLIKAAWGWSLQARTS